MGLNLNRERIFWRQGLLTVAGVDEVGRGAWAGPVLAAAVIVPAGGKKKKWHSLIRDSKRLTPRAREEIFGLIKDEVEWAVGLIDNRSIDRMGIAEANKAAVALAVENLPKTPNLVLSDFIARLNKTMVGVPTQIIINGDGRIFSIALASIIAKVQRDRLMVEYETVHPGYGFAKHKGYGTKAHAVALRRLGPCAIHRLSYRPVKLSPAIISEV